MITLWHQNSHDDTSNAKDNIGIKNLILLTYSRLYFASASDLSYFMFFACFVNTKTMKTDLYVINLSLYMQKNSRKRNKLKNCMFVIVKKVYIIHWSDFAILPILDGSISSHLSIISSFPSVFSIIFLTV